MFNYMTHVKVFQSTINAKRVRRVVALKLYSRTQSEVKLEKNI